MDTRVKIISTTLAFLICIVTTSCEDKNVRDDKRSEDVTAALAAVDDSVAVNSPHVLE